MLLIVLVMMSLKSFSQTATDSVTIQLSKPIAKLVIKDLIKLDGLETELLATKVLLKVTNKKLDTQGELNTNLNTQVSTLQEIIQTQEKQVKDQEALSKLLQRDLKKQKLKTRLTSGAGVILAIGAAVLIN